MSRSFTAEINAFFRARETLRPDHQRILQDQWAHELYEGDLRFQAVRWVRFVVPPLRQLVEELQTAHCVRHASVDKLILEAVDDGFDQVVLLGAGYDMRRRRFAEALKQVRWFEVDRRTQLSQKARLLPESAVQVESELLDPGLMDRLRAAGLDPSRPTLYILEGVIHYLPLPEAETMLKRLGPGRLVLSYIKPQILDQGKGMFGKLWEMTAEIPVTFLDQQGLGSLGAAAGWNLSGTWDFSEQVKTFAPTAGGRTTPRYQDVAVLNKES